MPIVPTAQPRVGTAPLPGVRVRGSAPAEAFAPAPDLSGVERVASQLHAQAMQEADQIAVNGAEVQAADLRGQVHAQITAQKGTNALGALDQARQTWQDGVAKITDGLVGDRQKQLFQQRAANHWVELANTAQQHAATELNAEDTRTTNALLENADKDAVDNATNPAAIALAVAKKRATVADYGRRQGWSADTVAAQTAKQLSTLHLGVIESLVDSGQDLAAKQYLADNRGDLTADALHRAETLGRASSIKGEGQRIADAITANADLSLTEALAKVPTDTDPDVREHAENRIRRAYFDRAADERQGRAQAYQQASEILEKTGDLDNVPLTIRAQLSPTQNSSLQHREKQLGAEPGDDATFFRLMNMAAISPATREAFLKENLLAYPNLSEVQRRRLLNKQFEISRTNESRARSDSIYAARHGETTTPATTAPATPSPLPPAKPIDPLAAAHLSPSDPAHDAPKKKPTAAMLQDVQAFGAEYGNYLREHGYDIPADAHVVPPAAPKKK